MVIWDKWRRPPTWMSTPTARSPIPSLRAAARPVVTYRRGATLGAVVGRMVVVALVVSCAPAPRPAAIESMTLHPAPPQPSAAGPRHLVGETCVGAQLSRPHVFPLFAGGDVAWTADESVTRTPLIEGPQRFTVLGFDGKSHGQISTSADGVASAARGFVGTSNFIGGGGPCAYPRPDGSRVASLGCGAAGGCGISVAIMGAPAPPSVTVGHVCRVDGSVVGDFDGDGATEAFPLEAFRRPGDVDGVPYAGGMCAQPHFAWYRLPVDADVVDFLGVVDLDGDSRLEVLVAYTPAGGPRTVTLYTPASGPARRLDRRASVVR